MCWKRKAKKNMIEINVSARMPYHTQVNNSFYPYSSCNTTSAIMFMLDNGVELPDTGDEQPEDALTKITETPEAYQAMRTLAPWAFKGNEIVYRPREVHAMLGWAMEKFVGKPVSIFRTDLSLEELALELVLGRAAIVTGQFTPQGHVIVLVGLRSRQDDLREARTVDQISLPGIDGWFVDDPYGDYHQGYMDQHGNDHYFEFDEFNTLTREFDQNKKWAHIWSR